MQNFFSKSVHGYLTTQCVKVGIKSVVVAGRGRGGGGEEPDEPGEGGGEEEDPGAGGGQEEGGGGGGGGRALPLQVFQQDHQDHRYRICKIFNFFADADALSF